MRTVSRRVATSSRASVRRFASSKSVASIGSRYLATTRIAASMKQMSVAQIRKYTSSPKPVAERIAEQVKASPVVVYMKGTPKSPQCGFSRAVVEVLRRENLAKYDYYNILEDEVLRQGVKDYSNWPTIPQVYIGGEFVGGCDIILDMHGEGTLTEALQKAGAEIQEH